jgi:hypothetical protein
MITGRRFFPALLTGPFSSGLHAALDFAIAACLVAAGASWTRGSSRNAALGKAEVTEEDARQPVDVIVVSEAATARGKGDRRTVRLT